jgi:hypothetical protein
MDRVEVSGSEITVTLSPSSNLIIQNISSSNIQWSTSANSTHKFVMLPNEMISVDFNVYLSSNAAGTQYAVVGRLA